MLIDLSVACAWIAMSLAGAIGLGLLRRFAANASLAVEPCSDGEEVTPEELYSLKPPTVTSLAR